MTNEDKLAFIQDAIHAAMTAPPLTVRQRIERAVGDALRLQGASEDEIAVVIGDKSRFSVDADGSVNVRLPGRVESVDLSFGFTLDEP